mmetsp:Transcript_27541/g.66697  ORF Transcript_27541/g.66697 Transcript_27541/m.66697 type:complete len:224 (-) Transcript_27541:219-890(-)
MEVDRESDGQPRARDVRLLVVAHDPEHLGAGRGAVVRRRRIDAAEGGMDDVRRAHGGEVRGVRAHRPHHLIERHRAQQRARLVELAHGRAHPLDRRLAVTARRHDQVDARHVARTQRVKHLPVAPELRVAVEVEAPRQRVATQVDPDDRVDAQRLQRLAERPRVLLRRLLEAHAVAPIVRHDKHEWRALAATRQALLQAGGAVGLVALLQLHHVGGAHPQELP